MRRLVSCVMAVTFLALGANARAQVAAAAPGPPPPYAGDAPPPRLGPVVLMRADNGRATLQVQTQLFWQDVCVTPCGIPVDPRGLYRVGGNRFVPSDTFTMPRPSGQVVIEARMGSRSRNIVGTALTFAGLGVGVTGGILVFEGSRQPANDQFGDPNFARVALYFYGVIALVAGIALTVTGIPLWATSGTTADVQ